MNWNCKVTVIVVHRHVSPGGSASDQGPELYPHIDVHAVRLRLRVHVVSHGMNHRGNGKCSDAQVTNQKWHERT